MYLYYIFLILPKPPIKAGITIKKIIIIACAVIILLYNWLSDIYCTPGPDNSNLISTENAVPNRPENNANIKYKVPMSLALDDKNHLSTHSVGCLNVNIDGLSLMDATSSVLLVVEKYLPLKLLFFVYVSKNNMGNNSS